MLFFFATCPCSLLFPKEVPHFKRKSLTLSGGPKMPFDANYKSNNNNNNNNNKQLGLDLQKGVYSSLTFKKKIQKT